MRKPPAEELCRGLDRLGDGTVVSMLRARDGRDPIWISPDYQVRPRQSSQAGCKFRCAVVRFPSSTVRVESAEDVKKSDRRDAMAGSVQYGASDPMSHGV